MKYDNNQRAAILHKDGPMLVLAGPGSGKTFTIVQRINVLVNDYHVSPDKIMVLTFTKSAANNMRQRFLISNNRFDTSIWFSTIHSLCYNIIKTISKKHFTILNGNDKYQIFRIIIKKSFPDEEIDLELLEEIEKMVSYENNRSVSSTLMPMLIDNTLCFKNNDEWNEFYYAYKNYKKAHYLFDFDDLLLEAYQLLNENIDYRRRFSSRFKYILVDEFQDTNEIELAIIKLIAYPENNVFVVGDDDQSIYAFAGATPRIVSIFRESFKNTKETILSTNYRSDRLITLLSNKSIRNNPNREEKSITSYSKNDGLVKLIQFSTTNNQYESIAEDILYRIRCGQKASDIAVLVRMHSQENVIRNVFQLAGIKVRSNKNINTHTSLIEYMKCFLRILFESFDINIIRKIISFEKNRGIAFTYLHNEINSFEEWIAFTERVNDSDESKKIMDLYDDIISIKNMNPSLGMLFYLKAVLKIEDEESNYLLELSKNVSSYRELYEKIKDITWTSTNADEGVTVMTMHQSKGLEFDTVYLPDLNNGIMPIKNAVLPHETEEERRLFYVALTRAKHSLILSYVSIINERHSEPSAFLEEVIDLRHRH